MQGLLCGVLQVIIQKLSEQDVTKAGVTAFADTIMEALLSVFACHSSTVHEEAMLAVGALTYACGTQFNKYMERFYPYLKLGLENHQVRTSFSCACIGTIPTQGLTAISGADMLFDGFDMHCPVRHFTFTLLVVFLSAHL